MPRRATQSWPVAAVIALALVLAALTLVSSPASAGGSIYPSTGVTLYVEDSGDNQAGENAYIPFYVHILNRTGSVVSGATLRITGPGQNDLLTPGCLWDAGTSRHLCPLEDLYPRGSSDDYGMLIAIQSLSPAASATPITTTFEIALPFEDGAGDHDDSVDFTILSDVLSLWMTSYPQDAPSGGTLEYQALIKNGSGTTATGMVLQIRFGDCYPGNWSPGCTNPADYSAYLASDPVTAPISCTPITPDSEDRSPELFDLTRPWLSTCTLPDIAPGQIVLPIRMVGPACTSPAAPLSVCVLNTSFRITYAEMGALPGATFWPNDEDYKPAYVRPEDDAGQDGVTQASDLPLADAVTTTSLDGDGLAATDPTAVAVTLPSTFTGSAAVSEVQESGGGMLSLSTSSLATMGVDGSGRFRTTARPGGSTPPSARSCFGAEYGMDCQSVDFTLTSPIERTGLVYRLRFLFHPSLFTNMTTGRLLGITSVSMFHDGDLVLPCPKGTTLLNYNSKWPEGIPCLSARRLTKSGSYEFIVLTGTNGNWKPGR